MQSATVSSGYSCALAEACIGGDFAFRTTACAVWSSRSASARMAFELMMGMIAQRTPLDIALIAATKARKEAKLAVAESEINLGKMYARDHDGMITAKALLVAGKDALGDRVERALSERWAVEWRER